MTADSKEASFPCGSDKSACNAGNPGLMRIFWIYSKDRSNRIYSRFG